MRFLKPIRLLPTGCRTASRSASPTAQHALKVVLMKPLPRNYRLRQLRIVVAAVLSMVLLTGQAYGQEPQIKYTGFRLVRVQSGTALLKVHLLVTNSGKREILVGYSRLYFRLDHSNAGYGILPPHRFPAHSVQRISAPVHLYLNALPGLTTALLMKQFLHWSAKGMLCLNHRCDELNRSGEIASSTVAPYVQNLLQQQLPQLTNDG